MRRCTAWFAVIDVPRLLEALGVEVDHRRGSELWACCPLHGEATASWSIVDRPGEHDHGWWRCFGCTSGGGAVGLVVEALGLSGYSAAWGWIEERGLDAPPPPAASVAVEVRPWRRSGFKLPPEVRGLGDVARWPTPARRYYEARGLAAWQAAQWGIGFAVDGRLAGRVVIPYAGEDGALRSYSARAFDGGVPKYLTPDARENPDLGAVFGASCWPRREQRREVYVCEGAIDALACQLAGARAVAALNGSRLYPAQALVLSTFREMVVVSDRDSAGDRLAAELGAFGRWGRVRRACLPAGSDPAVMAARGDTAGLARALGCNAPATGPR